MCHIFGLKSGVFRKSPYRCISFFHARCPREFLAKQNKSTGKSFWCNRTGIKMLFCSKKRLKETLCYKQCHLHSVTRKSPRCFVLTQLSKKPSFLTSRHLISCSSLLTSRRLIFQYKTYSRLDTLKVVLKSLQFVRAQIAHKGT